LKSKFTRLAVIASCALGAGGVVAASAQAAAIAPPTLSAATLITPESAVLNGVINTGNKPTSYTFQYDTLSDWKAGGDNATYTNPLLVPASTSPVAVSAPIGCYPALTCPPDGSESPLQPNAIYEFQLSVQPGVTGSCPTCKYYYSTVLASRFGYFKTGKLGQIVLVSTTLPVVHGKAAVTLKCKGLFPCSGKLKITAKVHKKTVTCGSGKFSLTGNKQKTLKVKLAHKCLAAIAKTTGLKLPAKLIGTATTDQKGINKKVMLSLHKGKK
jgi:hypothetical protein